MTKSECVRSSRRGGGWSNLWSLSAPDRWSSFIRKKFGIQSEKPTCRELGGECSTGIGCRHLQQFCSMLKKFPACLPAPKPHSLCRCCSAAGLEGNPHFRIDPQQNKLMTALRLTQTGSSAPCGLQVRLCASSRNPS